MIELIWQAVFESKNRFLFEKTKKIIRGLAWAKKLLGE